jgi:tetratricopeptide (TPR) repeat protein
LISTFAQAQESTTAADQPSVQAPEAMQPGDPAPPEQSGSPSAPRTETDEATQEAVAAFAEPGEEHDAEAQAEYAQVVGEAIAEFDAGRWAEARALFLRAHELRPSARTFRTLGMTSFELREYPRAVTELEQALADTRRPLGEEQKSHVQSLLSRAKLFVGRYRLQMVPADASLWVDGAPYKPGEREFLQLGVGNHEIVARAPGHQELRRPLKVQGGEEADLTLTLRATAPPVVVPAQSERAPAAATQPVDEAPTSAFKKLRWTWVAAGAGVALGGASTALWLMADKKTGDIDDECNPEPCLREDYKSEEKTIKNLETAHAVTMALAITAGVGTIALFLIETEIGKQKATLGFSPSRVSLQTTF